MTAAGAGALARIQDEEQQLRDLAATLNVAPAELGDRVERLLAQVKSLSDEVGAARKRDAVNAAGDLARDADRGGVVARKDGLAPNDLRELALAVAPRVAPGYESLDTGGFVLALVLELVVGAVLGFLVFLVFAAIQSAGSLIDLFGGFTLAQAFDPQSMINGAQFTRLFQMTALALMFASGGYQVLIGGLTRSFDAFPLGLGMDLSRPV